MIRSNSCGVILVFPLLLADCMLNRLGCSKTSSLFFFRDVVLSTATSVVVYMSSIRVKKLPVKSYVAEHVSILPLARCSKTRNEQLAAGDHAHVGSNIPPFRGRVIRGSTATGHAKHHQYLGRRPLLETLTPPALAYSSTLKPSRPSCKRAHDVNHTLFSLTSTDSRQRVAVQGASLHGPHFRICRSSADGPSFARPGP